MILTDGRWLVSDESVEELHRFAKGIGLKKDRLDKSQTAIVRYELKSRAEQVEALMAGAEGVSAFTAVQKAVKGEA